MANRFSVPKERLTFNELDEAKIGIQMHNADGSPLGLLKVGNTYNALKAILQDCIFEPKNAAVSILLVQVEKSAPEGSN